ncbi:AAA family ATPase [Maridesulfovibrio ferrireducens]|uniref:AAA family ATPase n=1 Tax=Maridesulfovibrio ferrireducens TaxID=246191 RepID=UPI001A19219E|nr:AAA family ATPase [Maridesulfovibrio ferrireducens]MBI9109978.1 AAA family ATPase [Maridesulfovibrio ferrireducens]
MTSVKFSPEYIQCIGARNATDICTPSKKDRQIMLEQYCEIACMLKPPLEQWKVVGRKEVYLYQKYLYQMNSAEFKYTTYVNKPFLMIKWNFKCDDDTAPNTGWVSLYARLHNLSKRDALHEIARQYKIDVETPHLTSLNIYSGMELRSHSKCEDSGHDCLSPSKDAGWREVTTLDFRGPQGFSTFKVKLMEDGQKNKFLFPHCYWEEIWRNDNHYLRMPDLYLGCYPKPYPLSGQDLIEKYPQAKIVLTEDLPLAFSLNEKFITEDDPEYIAASWFGGKDSLDDVDYSPLEDRDVIYQPRADHASYVNAEKIKEKCWKVGCNSFRISKAVMFLRDFSKITTKEGLLDLKCSFEKFLVNFGRNVLTDPLDNLLHGLANSWGIREYKKWLCEVGLKRDKPASVKNELFTNSLPLATPSGINCDKRNLDSLIAPENVSIVVGDQDGGKSLYALTLGLAMSYKFNLFEFEVNCARNVYYLDAENPVSRISERKQQILSAYGFKDDASKCFQFYSGIDTHKQSNESPLNLFDPTWQEYLCALLPENSVLVVDNLLTLAKEASNHQSKFEELIKYFRTLGNKKISVILVHHFGKNGLPFGTTATEALCQNIIEIKKCTVGQHGPGANMTVTFAKCKTYPDLTGSSFQAYLPYNKNAPLESQAWVYNAVDGSAQEAPFAMNINPELNDLENKIIMELEQSGAPLKRSKIAKRIGCKSDKIKTNLTKLLDLSLIKKHGDSDQATKYSAMSTAIFVG